MKRIQIFHIACLCTVLVLIFTGFSDAARKRAIFDDRLTYDIYFGYSEKHVTVIKDVDVEGFEEIAGKKFLVIKAHGFNLKDSEGYILMDAITAILPNREFRVQTPEGIKIHHR